MGFENIPLEMRPFRQWVNWRYEERDGKQTKVPYNPLTGRRASHSDPGTWASFDNAVAAMQTGWYSGIGFVLSEADPFGFIDMDDPWKLEPDGTPQHANPDAISAKQMEVFEMFPGTYAERSPSGRGLHIICCGAVPSGRKRSAIEIYTQQRFMTMTGDVFVNAPIRNCDAELNALWAAMAPPKSAFNEAAFGEQLESDAEVIGKALAAQNGEKFRKLYSGEWQEFYESQSQADMALFDIIAFYSQNKDQIIRIFHSSALSERRKAHREGYINYMLEKCLDNKLPPIDTSFLKQQIENAIHQKAAEPVKTKPKAEAAPEMKMDTYSVPPGLVGEIAKFIYAQSPRQAPEIALAGALGFMAGVVGRAYNVSGTGLNEYVLLLAETGTGKEAIASGIDKLIAPILKIVPAAAEFIGPAEIASSQAVIKYMSKGPTSFVSIVGEFGIYLQQMASPTAPAHLMGLRRFLLDAYNKSGEGKVLRPSIYSDKDKNTNEVISPAFSLMGESTPEKFYEGLHEGLITEGLLPRFLLIEYKGKRPPLNEDHLNAKPWPDLIEKTATICAHALMLNSQNKAIHVQLDNDADELMRQFDKHCDLNINSSEREVKRHLWNRAHIKALKLAALIAVGCNPYDPKINAEVASWAINLVTADVRNMLARFEAGEIGIDNDETKQIANIIKCVKEWMIEPWDKCVKYAGENAHSLHSAKVMPYSFVQRKMAANAVFRKDKIGSTGAIKRALRTLCERGDLAEIAKGQAAKEYGTSATCYAIIHPKAFGI